MLSKLTLLLAATIVFAFVSGAQASIIPIGSSLTFGGSNLPGACTNTTCSDTVTFSSTPTLIDGGAVSIYETQVADGPNAEWDVWHISTVGGVPLAGNINAFWSLVMSYDLSAPVFFDAVGDQWTVNGTPVSGITNFGGICCATASNPILPGDAYYNSGFSGPIAAGIVNNWQQIFVSPYNFVSAGGIDPSTADGFNFALHFTLQNPVPAPEPSSVSLLGSGVLLVGLVSALRRKRLV